MSQEDLQAALQRVSGTKLCAQGAASVWASGEVGLDIVYALNLKAGTLVNNSVTLDFEAVLWELGLKEGPAVGGTWDQHELLTWDELSTLEWQEV